MRKLEDRSLRGKTILIIDSNSENRAVLRFHLTRQGFEILEAVDGQTAREIYLKHDPCFVLLETSLPDMDGLEVCSWMRYELDSNVPIIIVSSNNTDQDRIEGLKQGADDYIGKPYNIEELSVRIETVLRRTANRCSKLSYKGLTIKPLKGVVKFHDEVLDLTHFEYRLLYLFMTHPDQIFSREQIINTVYKKNEKVINERTVDVHIKNLREKIAEYTDYPFIVTLRGIGYKFATEG
ncbi:response regulator transcription factor [Neobacillus citreus]|uniref:Response regulator transcription factor n=1 Tax=Neobacillus citreus TaxID=2833578 RepID=A0A9J6N032_9BACI|nr:response regulator transcription factor [Neobacillus citreus]MCH6269410.1 response regulator transcription factor [Neobacillus citreus]